MAKGLLQILALPGAGETLVLSFASIGHDPARPPSPEFVRTATAGGRPALFVQDAARSWGHAAGFVEVVAGAIAKMRERQPIRRVVAIGQSMGGFAALVAAASLQFDAVLAIGPQSDIGPDEPRWRDWTVRISPLIHHSAPIPATGHIILLHGLRDDRAQALGFGARAGLDHILFPDQTHSSLGPYLKAQGGLQGLLDSAIEGDRRRLLRIAAAAGGQLRGKLGL